MFGKVFLMFSKWNVPSLSILCGSGPILCELHLVHYSLRPHVKGERGGMPFGSTGSQPKVYGNVELQWLFEV